MVRLLQWIDERLAPTLPVVIARVTVDGCVEYVCHALDIDETHELRTFIRTIIDYVGFGDVQQRTGYGYHPEHIYNENEREIVSNTVRYLRYQNPLREGMQRVRLSEVWRKGLVATSP